MCLATLAAAGAGRTLARALRTRLLRPWSSSLALLLVLALGMMVCASLLTVFDSIVLRPIPLPQSDRIVQVRQFHFGSGADLSLEYFTYREFERLRGAASLDGLVALDDGGHASTAVLSGPGEAERLSVAKVDPEFFRLLGVQAIRGSAFGDRSRTGANRILLSHGFWEGHFAGAAVVGRRLRLDGSSVRVDGVLPALLGDAASQALVRRRVDGWLPLVPSPDRFDDRSFRILGRLRKGIPRSAAEDELTARLALVSFALIVIGLLVAGGDILRSLGLL